MEKPRKNRFVSASGFFGKYLLRSLVYLVENLIALIGFIAIIGVTALIATACGLTVAGVVASVTAATATIPTLTQLAIFAIPLAAGEIIKKIYKDNLEWLIMAYKFAVTSLFTPKSFDITEQELAVKQDKHPEAVAGKYATLASYKAAKQVEYSYAKLDRKYPELDVAGRAGKRAFKYAATCVSNGLYWLFITNLDNKHRCAELPKNKARSLPETPEQIQTHKAVML